MKQTFPKALLLAAIILMDLLAGMEFDLFVPSFPELQGLFGLSPFWAEALLSINFIGYFLSLFFVGSLADRYGRKPIILMGIVIFIIGSVLCLGATSYHFLLVGRFLQGIGIAAPATLSFLIIADTYSLKQQQSLFGILNGLFNAAAGAAPVIGSYITLYFHWQGNFMTLLLLGLLSCVTTLFFIPTQQLPECKETLSLRGYIPLFQSKPLFLLMTFFVLNFVPYWVFVGMSPILYMEDLGVSLAHFGYYQGVLALSHALGCLLFGMIVSRYDQEKMIVISVYIFAFTFVSMGVITVCDSASPLLITLALLPLTIGQVVPATILYPLCLNIIPEAKGRVSAILQGGRLLLSAFFLQVAGYFYQGSFQNIGIILCSFILMSTIALFFVLKNHALMEFGQES